jgi:hypothetical protein
MKCDNLPADVQYRLTSSVCLTHSTVDNNNFTVLFYGSGSNIPEVFSLSLWRRSCSQQRVRRICETPAWKRCSLSLSLSQQFKATNLELHELTPTLVYLRLCNNVNVGPILRVNCVFRS